MRYLFLLTLVLFSVLSAVAQTTQKDSLAPKLRLKPVVSMDNKATWIGGEHTAMFGLKVGAELYPLRFGVGYCDLLRTLTLPYPPQKPDSDLAIRFGYWNLWLDRLWLRDEHWELKTAFQCGVANVSMVEKNKTDDIVIFNLQQKAGVFEISQDFHYKLNNWFAVGAAAGYRFMITNDQQVQQCFQAPMYAIRLKVFPVELVQAIFKKK